MRCVMGFVFVGVVAMTSPVQAQRADVEELAEVYEAAVFEASDGSELPYRMLRPKNYDPQKQYPLVVLLHGAGERGNDNARQLVWGAWLFADEANREAFEAFVIVPQCPEGDTWSRGGLGRLRREDASRSMEPLQRVFGLIEQLESEYAIDGSRRYVLGLSMGGYGTWDAIARQPEMFAAAVPICGGGSAEAISAAADVPVWAFHSSDDPVVPVEQSRSMVNALREAGGVEVAYTEYATAGHASWQPAFRNAGLLPWLFDQRRE